MQDHNSPTSLCISDFAKVITDKVKDDEESGAVEADWKFAAMVISADCLFLIILLGGRFPLCISDPAPIFLEELAKNVAIENPPWPR